MPKKVDPVAQRLMIAEAAVRVIACDGIEGAKLRDIARAANITTGTIMHYYESKQHVLESVLELIVARTIARMQRCYVSQSRVPISKFISDAIHQLPINEENSVDWRVWLAFCGAAVADRDLLNIHRRHYRKLVSRVMLLLHRLHVGEAPFEEREPQRIKLHSAQIAVLAVPERRKADRPVQLTYPRQVHRCAEAVIAAIEGIGARATLDPDRWPLWCQAEALVEMLTPLLENFGARAVEENNGYAKITRLAA